MSPAGDRRPPLALRRTGRAEGLLEPAADEWLKLDWERGEGRFGQLTRLAADSGKLRWIAAILRLAPILWIAAILRSVSPSPGPDLGFEIGGQNPDI
jgi:hypothetical protein